MNKNKAKDYVQYCIQHFIDQRGCHVYYLTWRVLKNKTK